MKIILKSIAKKLMNVLLSKGGKSALLVMINETIFRNHFDEAFRVYRGIYRYHDLSVEGKHIGELRRNIHRIEKGLISKNRKTVFASAYIGDTVQSYTELLGDPAADVNLRAWSHDVLSEYFSVVDHSALNVVSEAYQNFISVSECEAEIQSITGSFKPIPLSTLHDGKLQRATSELMSEYTMPISSILATRRSTRQFNNKAVPIEMVETAVIGASTAPSACNRQPFALHTFSKDGSPDKFKRLMDLPIGADSFKNDVYNLGILIGDLSYFNHPRDRHIPYIDGSLFLMQFLQCLTAVGLASCVINWADIRSRNKEAAKLLNLSEHQIVICYVVFGYADQSCSVPASAKKSPSNIWIKHD